MELSIPESAPAHCKTASSAWHPFHVWGNQIPADLKARIQRASDGIKDGSKKIDR